ncbi:CopG family transcriptional regulator [bacterium]|nr:CopG family transcriptional regulator [candidate division CSSED10-310 bacterium]
MNTKKDAKATIKIPRALYNRLKTIIDDSGFDSVTDFIVYVLRDIAASASQTSSSESGPADKLSLREIERVRERLKRLGYL